MSKRIKEKKNKDSHRKKTKWNVISIIIIIVCLGVFSVSAYKLYGILKEYKTASDQYSVLATLIPRINHTDETEEESSQDVTEESTEEVIVPGPVFMDGVDWKSLYDTMYGINSDYQGWIYISDSKINYPVAQGTDNEYYLTHTFYKEEVFSASLFVDYRVENGIDGKNAIIYGHNMKDGSMFAGLKKFRDESFRKRHLSFSIYTSTGAYEYKIFASYTTSPESQTYTVSFDSDESFMNYIQMVESWSDVDYGVDVAADDQIVTLSTCVNNNQDRYVIQAKRIK